MNQAVREVARTRLDGLRAHRGAAQSHRGGDPRLRSLPVLRHPCARKTPLLVELADSRGEVLDRIRRD